MIEHVEVEQAPGQERKDHQRPGEAGPVARGAGTVEAVVDYLVHRLADLENRVLDEVRAMRRAEEPAPMERMLTVADLAQFLRAEPRSVHRWWRDGVIPAPVRVGGTLRWYRRALFAWLEEKGVDRKVLDAEK